jgi:hypothetical protein
LPGTEILAPAHAFRLTRSAHELAHALALATREPREDPPVGRPQVTPTREVPVPCL